MQKYCDARQAGQDAALARKTLNDAGYPDIPIITSGTDRRNMHPGFRLTARNQIDAIWGITLVDGFEKMRRRVRPYERAPGESNSIFVFYLCAISDALPMSHRRARRIFRQAVEAFNGIPVDIAIRRPRVAGLGEILLNFHLGANGHIEDYLEAHGMEVVLPGMHEFFRKNYFIDRERGKRGWSSRHRVDFLLNDLADRLFDHARRTVEKMLDRFAYIDPHTSIDAIVRNAESLIDLTYVGGAGWLIPGEIIEFARHGVASFVIVQPFGCLPNHITGRGMTKAVKKLFPGIQIVSLDYDPDTSFANVENRLQMLVLTAKEHSSSGAKASTATPRSEVFQPVG
jgi:predicted nucleotide-binding protein (sugar kinase/HSP70/actin superfamily)